MASITKIEGVKAIVNNLRRADERFARSIAMGLKKGGLYLQRVSQKQAPREFGFLRSSARTEAKGTGFRTMVGVGYTAPYALYVHERVEMSWRGRPRGVDFNKYDVDAKGKIREKGTGRFTAAERSSDKSGRPHIGNYWDPAGVGKAKFLEDPVKDPFEKAKIRSIVIDVVYQYKNK